MLKSQALEVISNKVATCTKCGDLSQYRTDFDYKTVPGVGHPNADILILGEAPGEDEANSGIPFVGKAGKLLDKIIVSAGWKRENLFICNILKCRPPRNRTPTKEEATNCRPFLDLQIKVVDPKWIICLGRTASIYLLDKPDNTFMGKLRGEHEYKGKRVICTYHPSYLLRNPAAKADVWADLQPVILDMNQTQEQTS
jgi:uracil-DNA glycosylase family 4